MGCGAVSGQGSSGRPMPGSRFDPTPSSDADHGAISIVGFSGWTSRPIQKRRKTGGRVHMRSRGVSTQRTRNAHSAGRRKDAKGRTKDAWPVTIPRLYWPINKVTASHREWTARPRRSAHERHRGNTWPTRACSLYSAVGPGSSARQDRGKSPARGPGYRVRPKPRREVSMNPQRTDRDDLVVALDGNKLARACAVRGWSFAHLARQARISRPTMTAALRGHTLRPLTAWKIARALGEASTAPELTDLVRNG